MDPLWCGSAFYAALGIIPLMAIIHTSDIIRGLDSTGSILNLREDIDRERID